MRIALVGCGYVADYYAATLPNHRSLELAGATDRDPERLAAFARHHGIETWDSLEALLGDDSVELVVNLTNPDAHYAVSRACLEAGRHVYSEKPLAMRLEHARELVELAAERGLGLSSAPCSVLGEAAQTAWRILRDGRLGNVHLVYAELDDGLIHRTHYRDWKSGSGAPWPWRDEFEVGCTIEHAGYYLAWLLAFFGPVASLTAHAATTIPDKRTDAPLERVAPDFSVACLEFESGVTARLTCSIAAPPDRSLRIIGEQGILRVKDCWDFGSPVHFRRRTPLTVRMEKSARLSPLLPLFTRRCRLVRRPAFRYGSTGATPMDFARGIAELADAVREGRPSRLSAEFALHMTEVVLAIQQPEAFGTPYRPVSHFEPMEPMPWARAPLS